MALDAAQIRTGVDERWDRHVLGPLQDYIRIPTVSPAFDPHWEANGHMAACDPARASVVRVPAGRTPPRRGARGGRAHTGGAVRDPGHGPGARRRHRAPVRAPGQAAGDVGLARRPRAVGAGAGGRPALRLPAHLDALGDRLGDVSLVVGLDSGAADCNRLWVTTSLRGLLMATVRVEVLEEGVHSGSAMGGFPPADRAGNVLRPFTEATLSCRLAPAADPIAAAAALQRVLTVDPPNGATITVEVRGAEAGWNAPPTASWMQAAVDEASEAHWGRPSAAMGEGGTIPFMGMLGERFPDAQFLITGVLGPGSNAHGPNELLHLPMARPIAAAVSHVLDAHARR